MVQINLTFTPVGEALPLKKGGKGRDYVSCLCIVQSGKLEYGVFQSKKQLFWSAQYSQYLHGVIAWCKIDKRLRKKQIDENSLCEYNDLREFGEQNNDQRDKLK